MMGHSVRRPSVALLAEGVDRNSSPASASQTPHVALLAEGVDRNIVPLEQVIYCRVALLAEGVDRNLSQLCHDAGLSRRPPRGGRG